MSPEGLLQLKKLNAHEHYLNSKSKKREANPLGRRPTNKVHDARGDYHHNNYNVENMNQDTNNDATTPTTNHDNSKNDGDYNDNTSSINNDHDSKEYGSTDDNTVSFK